MAQGALPGQVQSVRGKWVDTMRKKHTVPCERAFKHLSKAAYNAGLSFKELSKTLEQIKKLGKRGAKAGTKLRSKMENH